jgi:hypothetical protein
MNPNQQKSMELALQKHIAEKLELEVIPGMTEEAFIFMIQQRVRFLLDTDKDLLFSHLYRLDIDAAKINAVLRLTHLIKPEEGLALLIFERQVERFRTKQKFKQDPIEGWDSW